MAGQTACEAEKTFIGQIQGQASVPQRHSLHVIQGGR